MPLTVSTVPLTVLPSPRTDTRRNLDGKQNEWLRNYRAHVFDNKQEGATGGCTDVDSENACNPGKPSWDCEDYFNNAKVEGSMFNDHFKQNAYWIFRAVEGARTIIGKMYNHLTLETILSGLKVDDMVRDLEGDDGKDLDILSWLSASFTIIGGATAGNPIIGGVSTMMSGVFNMMDLAEEDEPTNGGVGSSIADMLEKTKESIGFTLKTAMGNNTDEEAYKRLPAFRDDSLNTNVGKFFNSGWWLIEVSDDSIAKAVKEAGDNFRKKVVDVVIQQAGFKLVLDRRENSVTKNCEDKTDGMTLDVEGSSYCVYLAKFHSKTSFSRADGDYHETMKTYGISDLKWYYESVIDCAMNGGDNREIDVGNMQAGKTPRCFLNMEAVYMDDNEGCDTTDALFDGSCADWKTTKIREGD